jgi:DNA-binding NtrC family response regulator
MRASNDTHTVATEWELDHAAAFSALARLSRATRPIQNERSSAEGLERALDILATALGADRVLVLCGEHAEHLRCGRRGGRDLRDDERDDVCRSVVEDALDARRVMHHTREPERGESVVELGIVSAMAAPLGVGQGVLYSDYRHPLRRPTEAHVELFSCAAATIAAILAAAHRAEIEPVCARSEKEPSLNALLDSAGTRGLRDDVEASLRLETPVMVVGESGTGKTLLAHAIARASKREPVVRAMLGASDDLNTIVSELFGHERGAFSGAVGRRAGLVELADGGTIILDEVLNLSLQAQQVLLDFTQFGTYRPLGWQGREPKRAKVRIIAVTNGDLERAVEEGRFRRDLYYRLASMVLRVPPLRERRREMPAIALTCLRRLAPSRRFTLSTATRQLLRSPQHEWPGNIRELESVLARACARAHGASPSDTQLRPEHFDAALRGAPSEITHPPAWAQDDEEPLAASWRRLTEAHGELEGAERALLERAIAESRGVLAHAARALGMPRTTLISRLTRAGVDSGWRAREAYGR